MEVHAKRTHVRGRAGDRRLALRRSPRFNSRMSDSQVDFSAPAARRKWPSMNKQRVGAPLGARPYLISEGTLGGSSSSSCSCAKGNVICAKFTPRRSLISSARFCRRNTSSSWYGGRTSRQPKRTKKGAINGVYKTGIHLGRRCQKVIDQVQHKAGPGSG